MRPNKTDAGALMFLARAIVEYQDSRKTPADKAMLLAERAACERAHIAQYLRTFGDFPSNLCVRVSAAMIDGPAPAGFANTSTVHAKRAPQGRECPAPKQGGKCARCRACWNRSIPNVSYHVH